MSNFSIKDRLAQATIFLQRQLVDKVVDIEGIPTNVLKITSMGVGMSGDEQQSVDFSILENVILKFPVNEVTLLESLTEEEEIETNAIDLWDLLPVELIVYFSGQYSKNVSQIKVGDIIVHVLRDEHNNKIPLLFQVSKPIGRFMAQQYLSKRKFELNKYRGVPEDSIREAIEDYLDSLE